GNPRVEFSNLLVLGGFLQESYSTLAQAKLNVNPHMVSMQISLTFMNANKLWTKVQSKASVHNSTDPGPTRHSKASLHNSSDPALTRHEMASVQNSTDPGPTCQEMASVQISSDPAPKCQTMALEHNILSPGRNCQENVSHGNKTGTTSNELDLLFSPMFDELLNRSSKVVSKSFVVSDADATHQQPHAENDQVADDEFIDIFSTPVQDQGETSSRHVDSSNMHTFYQRYPSEQLCSTTLPPMKKLDDAVPIFGPKTVKSILRSKSTFKAETLKGVIIKEPSSALAKDNKISSALKVNSAPAIKLKSAQKLKMILLWL
nr:hypothetical protein [Tanacetum cinerariifolium]